MKKHFALLFVLIILVLGILWDRHKVTSCFESLECTMERLNITDILVAQHGEGVWTVVTYMEGKLTLHRIELKGSVMPRIKEHRERENEDRLLPFHIRTQRY
jgi:hypothetical protein